MRLRLTDCASLLALVCALVGPTSSRAQTQENRIFIPIYATDLGLVDSINGVAAVSPPEASTIVVNFGISQINGGIDGKTIPPEQIGALDAAVDTAQRGHVRLFGYVTACSANTAQPGVEPSCSNPSRPALLHDVDHMIAPNSSAPEGYIDAWFRYAPSLAGIFLDEGGNLQDQAVSQAYFQTIYSRLKTRYPGKLTMINDAAQSGWINDQNVFGSNDLVMTYESDGEPSNWPPGSGTDYYTPTPWDYSRVFMLIGGIPESQLASVVAHLQNAPHPIRNFLVQDTSVSGSYSGLPSYWPTLAALAYGYPTNVQFAGDGWGRVQSTSPTVFSCETGSACGSHWSGPGVTVTLHAIPSAGSVFRSWSGPCTPWPSDASTCSYIPSSSDPATGTVTATFRTQRNTPMLSGIAASTTPSAASITWSTDITSDSTVDYGPTAAYGASASGNTGTAHSVNLAGLAAGPSLSTWVRQRSPRSLV